MHKVLAIARYEYTRHLRRRGFLFSAFGVPLLIVVVIGIIVLALVNARAERSLGMVDRSGLFTAIDVAALGVRRPIPVQQYPDEAAAAAAFDAGRVDAYVIVPADYLQTGKVRAIGHRPLSDWAERQLRALLRHGLLTEAPAARLERLDQPANLVLRTLDGGREVSSDSLELFFLPYIFAVMFLITVFTTSGYLLQAITEEKEDRVIELLATTVSPQQMMAGKILGLYSVGLTQVLIWLGIGVLGGLAIDADWLASLQVPWSILGLALIYFLLGYLLIVACYATIGAAMPTPQEAAPLTAPISLLAVSPMMLYVVIAADPNSLLAVILSLIPLSAPMTMLVRLPLADIPAWELAVSLVLLVVTAVGVMLLSARVMRLGMLRYGKRLSLRELLGRA